ncbi:MAG: rhomboid family intramembrane serine protease [Acidobacteriota bacterium]
MEMPEPEVCIKETYLSNKPAEGSALVAAASLLIMAGVSLLFWSNASGYASRLPANGERVLEQHQYWRLFTSILVHADLKHLLSNAVGIVGLGYLLYGYFGYRIYPLLIFGAGSVVTFLALLTYPPQTYLVGASGVVYLMAAFWLTMYVCLERRFSIGKRFLRAMGFLLIVLIPTGYTPEISYRTHAIGFGFGIVTAAIYFYFNKDRFRYAEVVEIDFGDSHRN